MASYVWLFYNPAPTDPRINGNPSKSWLIRTPADTEPLIAEASKDKTTPSEQDANAISIRQLKHRLDNIGVHLRVTDRVQAGAAGEWDPNRTEIRIRPLAVQKGLPALAEILAHEATHVAQSCHGGNIRKESVPLGIEVFPVERFAKQLNSKLYAGHPATRTVELEAFTAGSKPDLALILLEHYCRT